MFLRRGWRSDKERDTDVHHSVHQMCVCVCVCVCVCACSCQLLYQGIEVSLINEDVLKYCVQKSSLFR